MTLPTGPLLSLIPIYWSYQGTSHPQVANVDGSPVLQVPAPSAASKNALLAALLEGSPEVLELQALKRKHYSQGGFAP